MNEHDLVIAFQLVVFSSRSVSMVYLLGQDLGDDLLYPGCFSVQAHLVARLLQSGSAGSEHSVRTIQRVCGERQVRQTERKREGEREKTHMISVSLQWEPAGMI